MNIIELAREAGFDWHSGWTLDDDEPNRFVTFAAAVIAAHTEELIEGAGGVSAWLSKHGHVQVNHEGLSKHHADEYSKSPDWRSLYTPEQVAGVVAQAYMNVQGDVVEFNERINTLESTLQVALEVLAINQYAVADQAPHKDVMNYNALIEKIEEVLHAE